MRMQNDSNMVLELGNTENWSWFLAQAIKCIKWLKSDEMIVISDKDKGLVAGVQERLSNILVTCSASKHPGKSSCAKDFWDKVQLVTPNFRRHKLVLTKSVNFLLQAHQISQVNRPERLTFSFS